MDPLRRGISTVPRGEGESVPGLKPRTVAFHSLSSNLDPADTDILDDVFLKDVFLKVLATDALSLLSVTAGGTKRNGDSSGGSLSADAMRVTFASTAMNLQSGIDGRRQILIKER